MSIPNRLALGILLLLAICGLAYAQNLGGIGQNIGGGISTEFDGGLSGIQHGFVGTPSICTGTIDLSTGCAQPMLGGA